MKQTDAAYHYIKDRILEGTFKPAQKLVEMQLAESIGVSRNTVKQALLKLAQENLVAIEENKGATIKSFTLEEVLNYLEIREVLEGLVARSATSNVTENDLARMKSILEQMKAHLDKQEFDKYSALNTEFHGIIYKSTQNVQAVELINMIRTQLIRYQFRTILVPGRSQSSFGEHTDIYKAFAARNELDAEAAVRKHVLTVRETIRNNYHYLA
ncbi:MAG: GntR family transcriptional regulator [Firmicutes bacterium]|nr:GntR family transcriptional regulator [Bacillota bacterium]